MRKRIFQVILIVTIISLSAVSAFALTQDKTSEFTIQWTEISQFNNSLNITSSGRADITSNLSAFSVDQIKVVAELQQLKNESWTTIKTWTGTSTDVICPVSGSWYVQQGYYYRLISTGTVYIGGQQVEQANYIGQAQWY